MTSYDLAALYQNIFNHQQVSLYSRDFKNYHIFSVRFYDNCRAISIYINVNGTVETTIRHMLSNNNVNDWLHFAQSLPQDLKYGLIYALLE